MSARFGTVIGADLLIRLCEYLWLGDIGVLSCCSKSLNEVLVGPLSLSLFAEKLARVLCGTGRTGLGLSGPSLHVRWARQGSSSIRELRSAIARLTPWPTAWDRVACQFHGLGPSNIKALDDRRVVYQGALGGNRTIVADDHFPVLLCGGNTVHDGSASSLIRSVEPFARVITLRPPASSSSSSSSTAQRFLGLSGIAYYEVSLEQALTPSHQLRAGGGGGGGGEDEDDEETPPCVAVGLAYPGDNGHHLDNGGFGEGSMPGWNRQSFGYHSDDGNIFAGRASHGEAPEVPCVFRQVVGPELCANPGEDTRYGPGDTVGAGILYPSVCTRLSSDEDYGGGAGSGSLSRVHEQGAVFFTKNGKVISVLPLRPPRGITHLLRLPWFPAVGTDCFYPVRSRFGHEGEPFMLDLLALEARLQPTPSSTSWSGLWDLAFEQESKSWLPWRELVARQVHIDATRCTQMRTGSRIVKSTLLLPLARDGHSSSRGGYSDYRALATQLQPQPRSSSSESSLEGGVQGAKRVTRGAPASAPAVILRGPSGKVITTVGGQFVEHMPLHRLLRTLRSHPELHIENKDSFLLARGGADSNCFSLYLSDAMAAAVRFERRDFIREGISSVEQLAPLLQAGLGAGVAPEDLEETVMEHLADFFDFDAIHDGEDGEWGSDDDEDEEDEEGEDDEEDEEYWETEDEDEGDDDDDDNGGETEAVAVAETPSVPLRDIPRPAPHFL